MPIYEYRCHDCGHLAEQLRSMSDADKPVLCEVCQSQDTSRVQSIFSANSGGAAASPACEMGPMGGGCCGGGACGL